MRSLVCTVLRVACILCLPGRLYAQLPFYTDDTSVTERGKWHFEFFDEYPRSPASIPHQNQNTANYKLKNYGLPHNLEIDIDSPYLSIYRTGRKPGFHRSWRYQPGHQDELSQGVSATRELPLSPPASILSFQRET